MHLNQTKVKYVIFSSLFLTLSNPKSTSLPFKTQVDDIEQLANTFFCFYKVFVTRMHCKSIGSHVAGQIEIGGVVCNNVD